MAVAMTVIVGIFAADTELYTSLQHRAHSLAKENGITAKYERAKTLHDLTRLLEERRGQPLVLCCVISDGEDFRADDASQRLMQVWADQDTWRRSRPLLILDDSDKRLRELRKVTGHERPERAHSGVFALIGQPGKNSWKNIRDAMLDGLTHP